MLTFRVTSPSLFATALVPVALVVGVYAEASERLPAVVKSYLAVAETIARAEHNVDLHLDTRDIRGVARILGTVRERHAETPLDDRALTEEVRLWGSVLGEILRSKWTNAHWGPAKNHNRKYGHSVYVPLEGGNWIESNEFDLAERIITGAPRELPIHEQLFLHFVD